MNSSFRLRFSVACLLPIEKLSLRSDRETSLKEFDVSCCVASRGRGGKNAAKVLPPAEYEIGEGVL